MFRVLIFVSVSILLVRCNFQESKIKQEEILVDALNMFIDCNSRKACPDTFFIGKQANFNKSDFKHRIQKCNTIKEIESLTNINLLDNESINLIKLSHKNIYNFNFTDSFIPPKQANPKKSYLYFSPLVEIKELDYFILELVEIRSGSNITSELFLYKESKGAYKFVNRSCASNPY